MFSKKCEQCNHPCPDINKRFCSRKCYLENVRQKERQTCQHCGKTFQGHSSSRTKRRKYCSHKCSVDARTGFPHPGPRPRPYALCESCGKRYRQFHKIQRFCSRKCFGIAFRAENNPNWKGGYDRHYGLNWQTQRCKARKRDDYTCQICDTTENNIGQEMDVHHIILFAQFGVERYKEANTLDNLIALCRRCHLRVHRSNLKLPAPIS